MQKSNSYYSRGFTIVELLVVIVVIGILAAITIVSYTGITQRATASSLQSDLANASKQLKLFQIDNSAYPTTIDCAQPDSSTNKCLRVSSGTSFTYQPDNTATPQTFSLIATKGSTNYRITSDSTPLAVSLICPLNFIVVPGSSTYGTSDFCVMKYEAKQVGATTTPISQASGLPWVNISQTTAIANSPNVAGCTGCHLITEAEWLTIAQNVLNVASNWSGGAVGSGYIYSGHHDGSPGNALAADTNDGNGYSGTGNSSSSGASQRRTLTLSNGEVIWDMAGDVEDLINATIAGSQQPGLSGESSYAWKEWNNGSLLQYGLPSSSMPSYTGISGASGWSSTQGIGQLYSNHGDASTRSFIRGGSWGNGTEAGVLELKLNSSITNTDTFIGFRVSR